MQFFSLREHQLISDEASLPRLDEAGDAPILVTLSRQDQRNNFQNITWEVAPLPLSGDERMYRWMAPAPAVTGLLQPENTREAEQERVRHFEALQKSERFYRNLFTDSLNGMLLMEATGTINYCSPSVLSILGYGSEAEVLGRNGFEFVHPEDFGNALEAFQLEVNQTPEVKFIVIRLLKKNGEWLWCMVRGHNLLSNPHVAHILVYFHDDTPRRRAIAALEESEQRFRSLVRDLKVGVMLLDSNGHMLLCNRFTQEMIGLGEEEMKGRAFWDVFADLVHEDGRVVGPADRPVKKAIRLQKPVKNFVAGLRGPKGGARIWMIINADPVLDDQGNILHIVTSVTDITERKELEQQLLHEQVSRQKLLTKATIEGQEKERKEIGKELHDNIGQQLTTIKLYLDLAGTAADPATRDLVRRATKSVSYVINEIRSMSRALVPPTLGDLGLIESINELIDSISQTQRIELRFDYFDFEERLLAEDKRLMLFRILQEQLNNVLKHARASLVTIVLRLTKTEVALLIEDDGKGFDTALPRRGMGLANMKSRAELFGGQVEVISTPGKGCTVKVTVPHVHLVEPGEIGN
ncbi:PAS domain S-box protein [Paraflavisolibacter sp. H34]|uniref:PAS domain-containing sensor histidine kinase n=1 Tax=Huijunlia imazamoxiresistens TaxID=3127457 RepID=UPI003015E235